MAGTTHIVKPGECVATIAAQYGVPWKTIWDAPENATLRRTRPDPNVLAAGDKVVVPKPKPRQESVKAGQNTQFVVKREKIRLYLQLKAGPDPLGGEDWELTCGDRNAKGTTESDGLIEAEIPPDEKEATLILPKRKQKYTLALGELDPIDTVRGAQARMHNLGLYKGEHSGNLDDATRAAIEQLQTIEKLPVTGKYDAATQKALAKIYGF